MRHEVRNPNLNMLQQSNGFNQAELEEGLIGNILLNDEAAYNDEAASDVSSSVIKSSCVPPQRNDTVSCAMFIFTSFFIIFSSLNF